MVKRKRVKVGDLVTLPDGGQGRVESLDYEGQQPRALVRRESGAHVNCHPKTLRKVDD